jgi:hypothetical protein
MRPAGCPSGRRSSSASRVRASATLASLTWPKPRIAQRQCAMAVASGRWRRIQLRSSNSATRARSRSISWRSMRRSSVRPKRSSTVPRSRLPRASQRIAAAAARRRAAPCAAAGRGGAATAAAAPCGIRAAGRLRTARAVRAGSGRRCTGAPPRTRPCRLISLSRLRATALREGQRPGPAPSARSAAHPLHARCVVARGPGASCQAVRWPSGARSGSRSSGSTAGLGCGAGSRSARRPAGSAAARRPSEKASRLARHRHAVELDRALAAPARPPAPARRCQAQPSARMLAATVSPRKSSASACASKVCTAIGAGGEAQLGQQRGTCRSASGLRTRLGHRHLVVSLARMRVRPWRTVCSASGAGADDQVAGQHRVGLLGVDAHLVQPLGRSASARRQHRAALLREAHEVEHAGALALEVRGHRDQRADRDDAGAADAGDQQVVGAGPGVRRGPAGGHLGAGKRPARPPAPALLAQPPP